VAIFLTGNEKVSDEDVDSAVARAARKVLGPSKMPYLPEERAAPVKLGPHRKAGVEPKPRTRPISQEHEAIFLAREAGSSVKVLAQHYGLSPQRITNIVQRVRYRRSEQRNGASEGGGR